MTILTKTRQAGLMRRSVGDDRVFSLKMPVSIWFFILQNDHREATLFKFGINLHWLLGQEASSYCLIVSSRLFNRHQFFTEHFQSKSAL